MMKRLNTYMPFEVSCESRDRGEYECAMMIERVFHMLKTNEAFQCPHFSNNDNSKGEFDNTLSLREVKRT
jgi:hypothetical protein